MKLINITGQKFGRLTALKISRHEKHHTYWLCKCECGNLKEVASRDLRKGIVESCGCLHKERITKHRKCDTRLYSIWQNMKNRCYNTRAEPYKDWVDHKTQNRNTRHNRNITINNETHCLSEWCEILGLKKGTVYARLKHNWPIEKALNYGKVSD